MVGSVLRETHLMWRICLTWEDSFAVFSWERFLKQENLGMSAVDVKKITGHICPKRVEVCTWAGWTSQSNQCCP